MPVKEVAVRGSAVVLGLGGNSISDLSSLPAMTDLERLDLSSNRIEDISALSGFVNLRSLDLSNNRITDISALAGLKLNQTAGAGLSGEGQGQGDLGAILTGLMLW